MIETSQRQVLYALALRSLTLVITLPATMNPQPTASCHQNKQILEIAILEFRLRLLNRGYFTHLVLPRDVTA